MLQRRIYHLIFLVLFLKCVLAFFIPLVADEAYYYVWSLRPQLSYYDHPAMVSWLIYLGTHFIAFKNPIAVRLFFVIVSTLSLYIWILILKKWRLSDSLLIAFIILFNLNPMLGLGSILATPDVPLVFFWSLSYLFYLNLLNDGQIKWYFLFGAALGLGFCSKYLIVLFVLAGLLALIFSKKYKQLSIAGVFVTIFSGALFSLPVLVWNYNNEWVSFLFQINHGFGRKYYDFNWTSSYLIGQFLIVSPLIFIHLFKKPRSDDQTFSLTQILFFVTSTFKSVVEANWAITSYGHAIAHYVKTASVKNIKFTYYYWAFIYLVLFALLLTPQGIKALKNQPTSNDVIALRPVVEKYRPLYGPNYQISSLMTWDQQILIPKLRNMSRTDFYDHLPESLPLTKIIYVLKHIDSEWPITTRNAAIKKLDQFPDLELELFQVTYE